MKKSRALLSLALALALIVCLLLMLSRLASAFLYHPTHADVAVLARDGFRAESLLTDDGLTLRGLVRPAQAADAPWLIFFAGNAMGLDQTRNVMLLTAERRDVGLAAFAYRGYDGSQGAPSEPALLADAEAVVRHLSSAYGVAASRLVVAGQSLGTGVAAHLAHALARGGAPAKGLVLLSPYTSMLQVFRDHAPFVPVELFLRDTYRTDRLAADIPAPVVIVHGARDTLIAPRHAHTLVESFGGRARLIELPERDHNDLWYDERTAQAIRDLMESGPQG